MITIKPSNPAAFKAFAKSLSKRSRKRSIIKATNQTGIGLRKRITAPLMNLVRTSRAGLDPKARAAHVSQVEPAYSYTIARRIQIHKLKASARIHTRKSRGSNVGELKLNQLGKITRFRASRRVGKGRASRHRLVKAGPLRERAVGPINLSDKIFERSQIKSILRNVGNEFGANLMAEFQKQFSRNREK